MIEFLSTIAAAFIGSLGAYWLSNEQKKKDRYVEILVEAKATLQNDSETFRVLSEEITNFIGSYGLYLLLSEDESHMISKFDDIFNSFNIIRSSNGYNVIFKTKNYRILLCDSKHEEKINELVESANELDRYLYDYYGEMLLLRNDIICKKYQAAKERVDEIRKKTHNSFEYNHKLNNVENNFDQLLKSVILDIKNS